MRRVPLAPVVLAAALSTCLTAADDAIIASPAPLAAPEVPPDGRWAWSGRLGAFVSSVATSSSSTSRDPAIASARSSMAWLGTADASLVWREADRSADQHLRLRYGRIRSEGAWLENQDEVHYDGVWREEFAPPGFIYGAWGADSAFTSPVDDEPLDPITARVSVGYGQLWRGLLLESDDPREPEVGRDRLELRVGVRAQKRWARHELAEQQELEWGPEGFARYDRPIDPTLRWFVQYEIFTEFEDFGHVVQLVTAGLTAQLSTYVAVELGFRAYRESSPDDVPSGTPGYDAWGLRQDALVGVVVGF